MTSPCYGNDYNCDGDYKCCPDSCGETCKPASSTPPVDPNKVGYCPIPQATDPSVSGCTDIFSCESDSTCDGILKCCRNGCGGTQCTTPVNEPPKCTIDLCGFNPYPATVCPGTIDTLSRAECVPTDGGKCVWVPIKCPDVPPDIKHPGFCPLFKSTIPNPLPDCINLDCINDNDCAADRKCCYSTSACEKQICTPSVDLICRRTGYREAICASENDLTKLYPTGVPTVFDKPEDGILRPDACYRCADYSVCGPTLDTSNIGTAYFCRWDEKYKLCIEKCTAPPDPVVPPCSSRSLCECLLDSQCGWCQYTQEYNFEGLTTKPVTIGICGRKEAADKCTLTRDAGGLGGDIALTRPDFCSSTTKPLGFDNPADLIKDLSIKTILEDVNSGKFTADSLQDLLTKYGVTDVIIKVILQPSSDGEKGRISLTIEILGTKDETEYVAILNKVIAERCGVKEERVETTIRKESASTKRDLSQQITSPGEGYYQESTISPEPTGNSGFSLSPIWLLALLSFLLMRI